MISGLCTAAVTLTPEERQLLDSLPGAVDAVLEADECAHRVGHDGPHAFLVQVQEVTDEGIFWWVVWDGPEQPDSQGYEFKAIPPCWGTEPGGVAEVQDCPLPRGHAGDHRQ